VDQHHESRDPTDSNMGVLCSLHADTASVAAEAAREVQSKTG